MLADCLSGGSFPWLGCSRARHSSGAKCHPWLVLLPLQELERNHFWGATGFFQPFWTYTASLWWSTLASFKKKTKRKVQKKKKRNWLHNSSMLMGPTSCTQPTHNICVFSPTTQFWGIRLIFHLARQNSFHANLAPRFAPDLTSNLKASPKPQSQVPPWLLLQLWPHVYGANIRSGIMGNCRSFLALSTFLGGPFVEIFTMVHNGIIKADQKWRKLAANCTTKGPKAATFGRRI